MVDLALTFPAGFLWGAATSAHQVEGGNTNNNWAAWEQTPGHIFQNQTAGLACDWWNGRYVEDFDRAAGMHHNAHRFSVEWSRIEPERGKFDSAALDHYARMIAALRERGMEPLVTLHHFTDPLWITALGGWTNPETVRRFERFARLVVEELGQAVTLWCTINEPMVYVGNGYLLGRWPPGQRSPRRSVQVVEQLLRGHAAAYHAIKNLRPEAQVGFANNQISLITRRPALIHAPASRLLRQVFNQAFIEALMTGTLRFPFHKVNVPEARDAVDWIGLNYYFRFLVGFNLLAPQQLFIQQSRPRRGILGPEGVCEIWPEGLYEQLRWLGERTQKPLYVTENGVPDADDTLRPLHLVRSIRSLWQATNCDYLVRGYFYWTLADNFEWAEGYNPRYRFGLYGCDPETQVRTQRRSAELYGEICAAKALTADMVRRYVPEAIDELFPGVEVQREIAPPARA
ncbi:MAG TPA: family 1 glycosylhydrolase [Aggregatilineaceae bacterium]|jgi:beta-glucosidase|nr:family 1 glycosylhydrolase [Aggregatilineaceae bacterium]